jgi:hypothetical protein
MSKKSYIPKGIKEFREWAKNFDSVIVSLVTALGIPAEAMQALQEVKNLWLAADAAAENILTATKAVIHERVRVMGVYTKAIRAFVAEYVSHNHLLTPQQREQLGLPSVNPPSPQPAPKKKPRVEITTEAPGKVNIHCYGEETQWGMEEGVHGYEWGYVISDTKPESYDEFTHSEFSTRAHYSKTFDPNLRGKKLQSAYRWENEKGEKGPWTDFFETIIP